MPCDLKVLKYLTLLLIGLPSFGWSQKVVLKEPFDPVKTPSKPDYSNLSCWAALPEIKDCSDTFAGKEKVDCYSMKTIDVFFIHPTSFTYEPRGVNLWNGDIKDSVLNAKTDFGSIRYQASVFSGLANIYAPRYRQAHYYAYLTPDTASSNRAFNLAYEDVKNAFEHYLEHYHNGKGIILASHSQGTTHAIKLLKEMFDDKPLAKYLVAAYLVGMPVYDSVYTKLKPCTNSSETGCYLSWRTYAVNYFPENYVRPEVYSVCTNPLFKVFQVNH